MWFWIIISAVFLVGIGLGSVGKKTTNETTWKQLKEVDDGLLQVSANGFRVNAEALRAIGNADFATAERKTNELNGLSKEKDVLSTQRQDLLEQLGY